MKKAIYWFILIVAFITSSYLFLKFTETNISILMVMAIIATIGFLTQEKLGKTFEKQLTKIHKLFEIETITIPNWIRKFRTFCISIAIACFWAYVGFNFTDPIDGNIHSYDNPNQLFFDLTLFFAFIGILPQTFWTFNYGVNKTINKKRNQLH